MRGDPQTIYGKSKIIRRNIPIAADAVKVAPLNLNRKVLRFASPDAAGIVVSPHIAVGDDNIGEPVNVNSKVTLCFGCEGPLVQCEWYATSPLATLSLHVIEVITDCEGGGATTSNEGAPNV